ncbi:hypothetical protein FS749_014759 [Ceratobasidium sp. UAMH 11750]|nr:hypothetical protein FS749_014759 [Ceratobasidium sp. UAMH 11750]
MKVIERAFLYLVSKEFATGSGNVADFKWHIIEENKPFKIEGMDIGITSVAVHHGRQAPHKQSDSTNVGERGAIPPPEPYICFGFMFADILVYMSDVSHIPEKAWEVIKARSSSFEVFVEVLEAAKRVNAQRTYVVGFGHEIPHDGWETITRKIGGENEGDVRPLVREALERLSDLGVGAENIWIRPAYDGQLLSLGSSL